MGGASPQSLRKSGPDLCLDANPILHSRVEESRKGGGTMKDRAAPLELGLSRQREAAGSRTRSWLQNELVRVGLAETLCTYIMMVRAHMTAGVPRQTSPT